MILLLTIYNIHLITIIPNTPFILYNFSITLDCCCYVSKRINHNFNITLETCIQYVSTFIVTPTVHFTLKTCIQYCNPKIDTLNQQLNTKSSHINLCSSHCTLTIYQLWNTAPDIHTITLSLKFRKLSRMITLSDIHTNTNCIR